MPSLYEILNNAHEGEGITALSREFGLTPTQTEAAVTALLSAISMGLKQSTATPDGLGNLFGVMGQQQDLQDMYDDPESAFGPEGVAVGKDALSVIFGSPDVSRAVIDQAQNFSGVSSNILKKMLPVLAGVLLSGLMRSGASGKTASPAGPAPSGGSLGDILGRYSGVGCRDHPARPQNQARNFLLRPANRLLCRQTRAGSLPRRATSSVPFCENLKREFGRAASSRSLSAAALYRYPCRADKKVRCPPALRHQGRRATSSAKSYAISSVEPWAGPRKCRKGDRDSHRTQRTCRI
jgi:Bacterial protein of unknown function (DUF937)